MNTNTICPCCEEHYFEYVDFFETCPVCGWQDDGVQRNEPDYRGGANAESLNEYRSLWKMRKAAKKAV